MELKEGLEVLVGNTKQPKKQEKQLKKQGNQLKKWFFTYNNYEKSEIEVLEAKFNEICDKYIFQEEIGEECGTPHLQGSISLYKEMRWSQFNLSNKIQWKPTRNEKNADAYCCKEKTRAGIMKSKNYDLPEELIKIDDLRDWQKELMLEFKENANDRTVIWVYDIIGNVGKSKFTTHLYDTTKSVCFVDGVKKADIINGIYEYKNNIGSKTVILFDIPRNSGNKICYSAIESIKNGLIFNTKFETGAKRFNSPHICIFANEPPIENQLSKDRWKIFEIIENKLIRKEII